MLGQNIRLKNKAPLTLAAWLLLFALCSAVSDAKEWRGITPAKSTRGDVVRLFDQCSDPKARCDFSSDDWQVFIVFAGADSDYFKCAAQIPADTVLLIEVVPKAKLQLSDLSGGANFKELVPSNPGSFDYQVYLDEEAGLLVRTSGGAVHLVSYIAAAKDRQACADYYGRVKSAYEQFPLCRLPLPVPPPIQIPAPRESSEVGSITEGGERAALDNFAAMLRDAPSAQAYVIAYADRKSRAGDAQASAERAKTYLVVRHGMEDGRVVIVDGGYREQVVVDLFIVPAGATPPAPTPTIDPKKLQITPDRKVKKPGRNSKWNQRML